MPYTFASREGDMTYFQEPLFRFETLKTLRSVAPLRHCGFIYPARSGLDEYVEVNFYRSRQKT